MILIVPAAEPRNGAFFACRTQIRALPVRPSPRKISGLAPDITRATCSPKNRYSVRIKIRAEFRRRIRRSKYWVMRMFLGGRCYTAENLERDYLAELTKYSDARWEAPQRAARLAAAVKRYKTSEMLRFIFATIAYDPDPDLTPLTVKRLCNALFGRTGSQWLIVEVFGEKGRQHRSNDSSPVAVEKMAVRYRRDAGRHWSATLAEIERVKRLYQTGVKASKKGEG